MILGADHRIGYGAAALGNLYGPRGDDWPAIVQSAWESGVRLFDVAPHYGLGLAEERLGESLRSLPRDQFLLSTKVGRVLEPNGAYRPGDTDIENLFAVPATRTRRSDYSRDGVLRSVEDSLIRLGLERIDILFVHDPDDHEREALEGAFPALADLKAQGVIRAYGVGMNQTAMATRFVQETDLDIVMCAGRYTLLDRSMESDLLPAASARAVQVIAAAVFSSGILATERPRPGARHRYDVASTDLIARAERIADVAARYDMTIPELAVQFPLRHPAVSAVVLGADDPQQVRRNALLHARTAPDDLWVELAESGLV